MKTLNRRTFLRAAGVAAVLPWIVPARAVRASPRGVAPSETVVMGLIGCGGMGRANLGTFLNRKGVEVVAVCDPDQRRAAAARQEVEAFAAKQGRTAACTAYRDFRELLARDDVDAVIIASPDHWHALHVIHAAAAGKDIYGEKPLSLTVREGRAMADAVRRHRRVFQTGSQQRSDARFRRACELVRNGRLGTVHRVICGLPPGEVTGDHPPTQPPEGFDYDLWLGPAPWAPYCDRRTHYVFRHILDYSGGQITDWGAHHIDIAHWALGVAESGPTRVSGVGEFPARGLWNAAVQYEVRCRYENGAELVITSRAPNGVRFEGDRGWLFVTRGAIDAWPRSILEERIGSGERRLPVSDDHHQDFLNAVAARQAPVAPIEQAHRSITVAHLGNIAMQTGRTLRWDPLREEIVDDEGASGLLSRVMRGPWRL